MGVAQQAPPAVDPARAATVQQEVEHHHRPTRPAAPRAAEQHRPDDLRHRIVDDRAREIARQQVEEEALDLHVLPREQAQEAEHVAAHQEERQLAADVLAPARQQGIERPSAGDRRADIAEVHQVEDDAGRLPHHDRQGPEDDRHHRREEELVRQRGLGRRRGRG